MASIRSTVCPKKLQIESVHCPGSKNFYGKIQFQTKESLLTNQNDILILYFNWNTSNAFLILFLGTF